MSFGLCLCLVPVVLPGSNVHSHVYTCALLMFAMTVVMYGAWPWKFYSSNWAELMCKLALIVLLMLTTSFVDVDSVSAVERGRMNNIWAHLIIFTLMGACAFALALFIKDVVSSMQHVRINQVRTARAMWHLRDMSLLLLMMPEKEYARRLAAVGDSDRAMLMEVNKIIKNVIFGEQESSRWIQQRLIVGSEHTVWDHGQRVLDLLRDSQSGRLHGRLEQSMRFRVHLLDMAKAISQSGSPSSLSHLGTPGSIGGRVAAIRESMQVSRQASIEHAMGIIKRVGSSIFSEAELTQDAFRRKISRFPNLDMPEEEIDTLFSVLDSNGSGTVTFQKLTDLLAALAPEKVLRGTPVQSNEPHRGDSGESLGIQTPRSQSGLDEERPMSPWMTALSTARAVAPATSGEHSGRGDVSPAVSIEPSGRAITNGSDQLPEHAGRANELRTMVSYTLPEL